MSHLSDNTVTLVPPTVEPISLAEARRFLRIDVAGAPPDTTQDEFIRSCLVGARRVIEENIDKSIGVQTLMVAAESFLHLGDCHGSYHLGIELPYGPIRSIESIKYIAADGSGADVTMDPASYKLTEVPPQRVVLRPGYSWPSASLEPESVRITYVAGMSPAARDALTTSTESYADGYANDYTGSVTTLPAIAADRWTIPESLVIALRLLIGHYYVNRGAVISPERGSAPEMPLGVQWILWPNRSSIGL
jgi:uncharacterized phiE125 gp8 family phage protein